MLETVESSLGAPNPEEVAKQQRAVHTAKEPSENGAPDSNPGKLRKTWNIMVMHIQEDGFGSVQ